MKNPRPDIIDSFHEAFEFIKTKTGMKVPQFLNLMSIPGDCYDVISDDDVLPNIDFEKANFRKHSFDPMEYIKGYETYCNLFQHGRVSNMFDYLGHYNRDDVRILKSALHNYVSLFIENLDTNPLDFIN